MAFTLGTVITAARDRHPAFHRSRVTDAVLARFLTDYQNELIAKCVSRQPHYLDQSAVIIIALGGGIPGTTGAGSAGGLPATEPSPGTIAALEQPAGALVEALTSSDDDAAVWVSDRVATAVGASTISSTGAGRTTNVDVGRTLEITAGPGLGQQREILSNTSAQWTLTSAWEVLPTTASMFRVVTPVLAVQNDVLAVTQLPATITKQGYLVSLNAQGVPFIDYASPLVASVEVGVPLPSIAAVTGGTVRYLDGDTDELTFTTFRRRFDPPCFPAVWQSGETVFLCGSNGDWQDITSLEVLYTPIAPAFSRLTDYFLLPDSARSTCVASAAAFAALRLTGDPSVTVDARVFQAGADDTEDSYLASLRLSKRARTSVIRSANY
jgi:hypothetical protein